MIFNSLKKDEICNQQDWATKMTEKRLKRQQKTIFSDLLYRNIFTVIKTISYQLKPISTFSYTYGGGSWEL